MFTEGFTINGKHSYADYGLNVKKRQLGFPAKRSIRKTVPFMNGYHDFTRINGSDTWGERLLSYTFDIIGNTPAEVDEECTRILNWLGNVHEADIYDDTMPEYHLHGSFESASPTESEDGEQTELTVTFVCQPFKIANEYTEKSANGNFSIENVGQAVRLYVVSSAATSVTIGGTTQSISAGETELPMLLRNGITTGTAATAVTFRWRTEVL